MTEQERDNLLKKKFEHSLKQLKDFPTDSLIMAITVHELFLIEKELEQDFKKYITSN